MAMLHRPSGAQHLRTVGANNMPSRIGALLLCSLLAIEPVAGQPQQEPRLAHVEKASRSLERFLRDRIEPSATPY